jgi:hypothetical protein
LPGKDSTPIMPAMICGEPPTRPLRIVYLEAVPAEVAAIVRSCLPEGFELHVRGADESPVAAVREADFILVATTLIAAQLIEAGPRLVLQRFSARPASAMKPAATRPS